MPAGLPYFAWIDVGETVFTVDHFRWDEDIFSFTLKQDEGDPASLTVVVRKPRNSSGDPIGLLGPGRKIWCWFALDCGPDQVRFRGRLVGIPTSIFEELVTLEFVARPVDVVAQKNALAATLRVLPFYDEAVIDPSRATDPDVVLEGYTKVFHYDRETHIITVSDEITGEDGTVSFDGASTDGKVLYDGLGLTLTSGPLARVDVNAEYTWTQQARGTVDLTNYLVRSWPGSSKGVITSYTLWAADWPKNGAGIGDGWVVAEATAHDLNDFTVKSITEGSTLTIKQPQAASPFSSFSDFGEGSGDTTTTFSSTTSYIGTYTGQPAPEVVVKDEHFAQYDQDDDRRIFMSSYNRNFSAVTGIFPMQSIKPTLVAGYTAERQCTERVSFSLFADVQSILTDPEDGEALLLDGIRSVNLSEGGQIGDPRRRSYIATARGNQSLEHLIAFARAHLMIRARAVEITFVPKLSRMPEITLRKSAFLAEPRVGAALGKIISYSIALDGSDGHINCEVKIGCAIGRGGVAIATEGTPTYCSTTYAGHDYQQYAGRTFLVDAFTDSSVGYAPPIAAPNDDGINFLSVLRAENVIEQPLVVTFGADEQAAALDNIPAGPGAVTTNTSTGGDKTDVMAAYDAYYANILKTMETTATFKLKSMTGQSFTTDYAIQVTDLKIPTGYDLETV